VNRPLALYPAKFDTEKISFNQINRNTGHRIKYLKVDADTGEEVSSDDIISTATRSIPIPTSRCRRTSLRTSRLTQPVRLRSIEFAPKADIDPRYLIRPYYLVPDGKVGHDAFAVIAKPCRMSTAPNSVI
jgi:DNA end-binding protein Ku